MSSPDQPPLNLNENHLIAKGSIRKIYARPGSKDQIIKIYRRSKTPEQQKRQLHIRKLPWLRHPITFDQNRYDLREINRLEKRLGATLWQHFPKTPAILPTNFGPGLIQQRILNHDGTDAESLTAALTTTQDKPALLASLNEFRTFLANHHIVIRDLHPNNVLVQYKQPHQPTIIMVDGFGNSDYIKFASYLKIFNDQKLERKFTRLINALP